MKGTIMPTDIEIADAAKMQPITEIAQKLGLSSDDIEQYGHYKAKINLPVKEIEGKKHKLILVTGINPTSAGEGKSTVLVGLGDALNQLGHQTTIAMREPSMGPVFGIKGGATGGGYSQVVPMEDINLHFTGDMHALTSANNTLAALIDNYIMRDNALGLDPRRSRRTRSALRSTSVSGAWKIGLRNLEENKNVDLQCAHVVPERVWSL